MGLPRCDTRPQRGLPRFDTYHQSRPSCAPALPCLGHGLGHALAHAPLRDQKTGPGRDVTLAWHMFVSQVPPNTHAATPPHDTYSEWPSRNAHAPLHAHPPPMDMPLPPFKHTHMCPPPIPRTYPPACMQHLADPALPSPHTTQHTHT